MLTVVADTNLFLQCKSLAELEWGLLFPSADEIRVLVPRVIVMELDRLKNDGNARRAKRARAAVALLRSVLRDPGQRICVRESEPSVDLSFCPRSLLRQENFPDLDLTNNDDRLVAEASLLMKVGSQLVILTGDVGVELTAKEMAVPTQWIPDDWWLPPEPDAAQKELSELKEARRLEPKLSISFCDDFGVEMRESLSHELLRLPPVSDEVCRKVVEAIRNAHPSSNAMSMGPEEFGRSTFLSDFRFGITGRDIETYRDGYDQWVQELRRWTEELPEGIRIRSRIFGIQVSVANNGGGSAEELQLDVELSKGFSFIADSWLARIIRERRDFQAADVA